MVLPFAFGPLLLLLWFKVEWVNLFINVSHWSAFIKQMKKIAVHMKEIAIYNLSHLSRLRVSWWPGWMYLLWKVQHFFWWAVSVDWFMELSPWSVPCNSTVRDEAAKSSFSWCLHLFDLAQNLRGILCIQSVNSFKSLFPLETFLSVFFRQHNSSHHAYEEYQLWWVLGRNYLKKDGEQ